MKVYLAGPMTGIEDYNFPAFHAKTKELRDKGLTVFSPAEADLEKWGDMEGVKKYANYRECLLTDLTWICKEADAIYLLPGWERSKGVAAELSLAKALGLVIMHGN